MTFRETVGKWPVWKAAMVLIVILGCFFAVIEEMFVSRLFHVFDYSITHFEKTFKEEANEVDEDSRRFDEKYEYQQAESNLTRFKLFHQHEGSSRQDYICAYAIMNKKLQRFYGLAYVKHSEVSRKYIAENIARYEEIIKKAIDKGEFDPGICKEETLS